MRLRQGQPSRCICGRRSSRAAPWRRAATSGSPPSRLVVYQSQRMYGMLAWATRASRSASRIPWQCF